jgi:diguanylate cyclase (GGDEF)-like protein
MDSKRKQEQWTAWSIATSLVAVIVAIASLELYYSYSYQVEKTSTQTQTNTQLISNWVTESFELPKFVLKDIVGQIKRERIHYANDESGFDRHLTEILNEKAKLNKHILFIGVFNKDCIVTHSNLDITVGADLSYRDYCQNMKISDKSEFQFSNMFLSITNDYNISISYPITDATGQLTSFILLAVDLDFFQKWLAELEKADQDAISIFDIKQQLIARTPYTPDKIGQKLDNIILKEFAEGSERSITFQLKSPIDGIDRVWSFKKMPDIPLIVISGNTLSDALLAWRIKLIFYIVGCFSFAVVITYATNKYLRSKVLARKMKTLATIDPLTGLNNRREFNHLTRRIFSESKRYQKPFSILLIDIDHFKTINDNHGHDVGDTVLIHFAKLLQESFRHSDIIARWGGEEFIILLPQTESDKAVEVAEKLLESTRALQVNDIIKFTISIGVKSYTDEPSLQSLIKCADQALYHAKRNGRNRIQVSTEKCPLIAIREEH